MDFKWVLPDALAQAGFYHQPTHQGDDRTICFVCDLCLVAWEQNDQPWSEHERHSPICQYVQGETTDNVSMVQTASTQAAQQAFKLSSESSETIVCTSELSSERYFAVSNAKGHIIVYDSKDMLKVKLSKLTDKIVYFCLLFRYEKWIPIKEKNIRLNVELWRVYKLPTNLAMKNMIPTKNKPIS
jgi:hypothetical protein